MEPWQWSVLLLPIFQWVFRKIIAAPIVWLLYKIIPDGRLKVALFKERE